MVFLRQKVLETNKSEIYKRPGKEWLSVEVYTYVRSDLMLRIIKNYRSEKGRAEKK